MHDNVNKSVKQFLRLFYFFVQYGLSESNRKRKAHVYNDLFTFYAPSALFVGKLPDFRENKWN